jgi:hypothetical protein
MPTLPTLIVFQIELKCDDDPDLFIRGDIFAVEDTINPVKQDWVVKQTRPAAGQLVADHYRFRFNVNNAGKFQLSVVTPAAPEPVPVKFEVDADHRLGLVLSFKVSRR